MTLKATMINKDENVMINKNTLQTKLIDFGSACPISTSATSLFYGTSKFSCPEALDAQPYFMLDQEIWALGSLLFVLLFKMDPFANDDEIKTLDITTRTRFKKSSCSALICKMLAKTPADRPALEQVKDEVDKLLTK